MKRHRLLTRQYNRYLADTPETPALGNFLSAVSDAYDQSDRDRELLERSIELTSTELMERNQELREQIKELEKTKNALQESYSLLHASINSTYEAILVLDLEGNFRLCNPNFNAMFDLDKIDPAPANIGAFLNHVYDCVTDDRILEQAIKKTIIQPEHMIECEFQTLRNQHIEAYSGPHWLENRIVGQVWSFRDVTELKLKEEEARHRAFHDLLTGLPNRRLLSLRLNNVLSKTRQNGTRTIVLFIDLDGFKDVNDSLGHRTGDALLKEVSRRLEHSVPANTMLARHGGDEFVVVMEKQVDASAAIDYSEKVLASFAEPFQLGDEDTYMSASIGIAVAEAGEDDADKLISNADIAMYKAKRKGKNTFEFYDSRADDQSSHRLKIRNLINVALQRDQFELFFQPKVCLETGSIRGAEALIRWRQANGGYRSPLEFIPIAEESGQIIPISQWVIRRCCEHLAAWAPHLDDDFVLALNISAKHFQRGKLQRDMAEVIQALQVDPSKLELEVTETAIMDDISLAVQTLEELKKLGIRTAIDDFGTGHSSLSYLRKLPIEILKIDKSFIDEIPSSQEDRTLVRGIIDMVHALGIEVVAEGVENHTMAEMLEDMNCDLVQGYHYCPPVSEGEFLELIKNRQCYL